MPRQEPVPLKGAWRDAARLRLGLSTLPLMPGLRAASPFANSAQDIIETSPATAESKLARLFDSSPPGMTVEMTPAPGVDLPASRPASAHENQNAANQAITNQADTNQAWPSGLADRVASAALPPVTVAPIEQPSPFALAGAATPMQASNAPPVPSPSEPTIQPASEAAAVVWPSLPQLKPLAPPVTKKPAAGSAKATSAKLPRPLKQPAAEAEISRPKRKAAEAEPDDPPPAVSKAAARSTDRRTSRPARDEPDSAVSSSSFTQRTFENLSQSAP